jgi:hypothetical protein
VGHRTVVVLNNDQSHEWENDPELGKKIFHGAAVLNWDEAIPELRFPYGQIIEQVHADTQTLAVLDGCTGKAVAYTHWNRGQTDEVRNLALLKNLAERMGYRVTKRPQFNKPKKG